MHCPCPAPAAKQKRRHAHATRVHTGTGQTRAHARAALHCCRTPVGRPVWQLGVCMQQCTAVSGHQSAANGAFHFPIAGRDALPPSRARPRHTPLDPSPRTHSKIPGQSDTSAAYATHAFPNPWGKNMGDLTSPSSHTFACVRVVKCTYVLDAGRPVLFSLPFRCSCESIKNADPRVKEICKVDEDW
jgi:hypothetical protein